MIHITMTIVRIYALFRSILSDALLCNLYEIKMFLKKLSDNNKLFKSANILIYDTSPFDFPLKL